MKQLIKTFLPQPLMNKARDFRDIIQLSTMPKRDFAAGNLESNLDLQALFQDFSGAAKWEADHIAITNILGNDDKIGGVNPGDRRAMYMLVAGLKPKAILEIGTHIGASTLYLACAIKAASVSGRIMTVDIYNVNAPDAAWKKIGLHASPADNIKAVGCEGQVEFVTSHAQNFMRATEKRFDFIFLDGDHTAAAVYNELALALKILNPGGTILLHDYYPGLKPLFLDGNVIPGPFRALKRIAIENPDINVQPLGELPWPTKQGSRMTSLAIVRKRL